MPVETKAVGKEYPSVTYEVGLEKIREYANAVGEGSDVHRDRDAAKATARVSPAPARHTHGTHTRMAAAGLVVPSRSAALPRVARPARSAPPRCS